MTPLELLRAMIRGNVHAGYTWATVCADGEAVCERCTRENARAMLRATKHPGSDPQWEAIGLVSSVEVEGADYCAHCNAAWADNT